jgi:hypothetical protein
MHTVKDTGDSLSVCAECPGYMTSPCWAGLSITLAPSVKTTQIFPEITPPTYKLSLEQSSELSSDLPRQSPPLLLYLPVYTSLPSLFNKTLQSVCHHPILCLGHQETDLLRPPTTNSLNLF